MVSESALGASTSGELSYTLTFYRETGIMQVTAGLDGEKLLDFHGEAGSVIVRLSRISDALVVRAVKLISGGPWLSVAAEPCTCGSNVVLNFSKYSRQCNSCRKFSQDW